MLRSFENPFSGEMPVTVVVGAGAGDEGKGKVTDREIARLLAAGARVLSKREQGGGNAGHTIEDEEGVAFDFHQIPEGMVHPTVEGAIGNGYVDPVNTCKEMAKLQKKGVDFEGRFAIGTIVHFVLPHHIARDEKRERSKYAQGTTATGMSFVSSDKRKREGVTGIDVLEDLATAKKMAYEGLRKYGLARHPFNPKGISRRQAHELADEWAKSAEKLMPYIDDVVIRTHDRIGQGYHVVIAAAQAFLLDVDHGKKPYTSSDNNLTAGVFAAGGIPISLHEKTIAAYKIFPSKVGGGPFPTREIDPRLIELIAGKREDIDGEFGVTTGRPREVGYPDLTSLRRFILIERPNSLALTKFDKLSVLEDRYLPVCDSLDFQETPDRYTELDVAPGSARELNRCTPNYKFLRTSGKDIRGLKEYGALPEEERRIIRYFEEELYTPVEYIGTGPGRYDMIKR